MDTKEIVKAIKVLIISVAVVGVIIGIIGIGIEMTGGKNYKSAIKSINPVQNANRGTAVQNIQAETDTDIQDIEADLNSINDNDFNESGLSDQNLGL